MFDSICKIPPKVIDLWECHWQVWPMSLKLALMDYLSFSQAVSDSIRQAPMVSLSNGVLVILNLGAAEYLVSACICQSLGQLPCMGLSKGFLILWFKNELESTCPESGCLYCANIVVVESSHSSHPPVSHPICHLTQWQISEVQKISYIKPHHSGSSVFWIALSC